MADLENRCANPDCRGPLPSVGSFRVTASRLVCSWQCARKWEEAMCDIEDLFDYAPELDELHGESRTFPDAERRQ